MSDSKACGSHSLARNQLAIMGGEYCLRPQRVAIAQHPLSAVLKPRLHVARLAPGRENSRLGAPGMRAPRSRRLGRCRALPELQSQLQVWPSCWLHFRDCLVPRCDAAPLRRRLPPPQGRPPLAWRLVRR